MNNHPHGIARQLYRTSYFPAVDNSRPSSLNNPNFSQYHHQPILQIRPQSNMPTLLVTKSTLSSSQAYQMDPKMKIHTSDYYNQQMHTSDYYNQQNKQDDLLKQMQLKIEQLSKRVTKNSQDIKNFRKNNKSESNSEMNLLAEIERIDRRQQTIQREYLQKVSQLRTQLQGETLKSHKIQSQEWQKMILRFQQKQIIKIRSLIEDRVKQETVKIKLIIDNQTNKINQALRAQLIQDNGKTPIKSRLKYPFKSTKITYSEFLKSDKIKENSRISTRDSCESPKSAKILMSDQQVYYIDKQGFLLDQNNFYLLDKEERMIRLNSVMLEQLRREGMLQ